MNTPEFSVFETEQRFIATLNNVDLCNFCMEPDCMFSGLNIIRKFLENLLFDWFRHKRFIRILSKNSSPDGSWKLPINPKKIVIQKRHYQKFRTLRPSTPLLIDDITSERLLTFIISFFSSFPSWKYSKVDRELKVEELFPFVKQPCECLACTSNFLTLDEAPTGDREVLLQAEKNFEMTLTALQGFPCSVASQLDVICGEYDQILRKDTNINEFPKTEFIMWERAVFNAFFVACKVHSIWPLLRREFYDSPGEFLNENILSAGAAVVSCETIGKKS